MELLHFSLFAWFVPLAVIPILLHLLTLHRLKTVDLSTFRFLFDSYVQQRRRMRFLDALIALLRTLFLLFLVLAIARPMVRHWESLFGGGSGREVVLMIDCSASMNALTNGVSAFDRAKSAAISVVERLERDDRVTLIRVGAKPKEIFSRFTSDVEAIGEQISALETSPSRPNLFAAFSHLFGQESQELADPNIFLFTDSQASGWSELQEQQSRDLIPEGVKLTVVDVGSRGGDMANRAVVGDAPRQHRAVVGLPLTLKPRVTNFSATKTQDAVISVFVDEKEIARKSLTLQPGKTQGSEFIFIPNEPGVLRGRFEIPSDRFPDDDTFLFTLTVEPHVSVLLINGNPAADPFENEGLYLRTALTTVDELPDEEQIAVPELQSDKSFIRSLDVRDIPEAQLNSETLRDANVVILANCGALKAQQFTWLRDFVSAGGGLIVFPGDKVNPDVYNKQFFPLPGVPDQQLTSAQLTPPQGDVNKADTFERFASIDFAHPILEVFDDPEARYLTNVSFYRRFPLKLPKERGNTWPMAELSSGAPALVESRFGSGRVLLAAFPMNTKWTNLPLKPEFVPLVLRMVSHVRQRSGLEGPSVVPAEGVAELSVTQDWAPVEGNVADVAGRKSRLEFQRSTSRLMAAFDQTAEKGYYSVEVRGGRAEQPKQAAVAFAVNLAPEESDFSFFTKEQFRDLLPGVDLTLIDASAEAQQLYGSIGQQREVWRPLIVLLFAIIGIEFLLSTLGGQKIETDEAPTTLERIRDVTTGSWVRRMTGAETKVEADST